MIRLGLVQASAGSNADNNLKTLRQFAAEGKAAGCAAICFPEASYTTVAYPDGRTSRLEISGAEARIPLKTPMPKQMPMIPTASTHTRIAFKK